MEERKLFGILGEIETVTIGGGAEMEVNRYCEELIVELDAWKEKANHIATKLDTMTSGDKKQVLPEIIELHMLVEELCDRIDKVKRNCQEAWQPDQVGVTELRTHTTGNWDKE